MFQKIMPGIWWLLIFWIVSNAHIVLSTLIDGDLKPELLWLKQSLQIAGPIIFGLLWLFIEEVWSGVKKEKLSVRIISVLIMMKSPKWFYECLIALWKLIMLLGTCGLILGCFRIYTMFLKEGLTL